MYELIEIRIVFICSQRMELFVKECSGGEKKLIETESGFGRGTERGHIQKRSIVTFNI